MKATNPSIAKLLLPALLLAFFRTQAGATIIVDSPSRQVNSSSGAAGINQGGSPVWEFGPLLQLGTTDVGLFNTGPLTSTVSVSPYAMATTSASQDSNIDTSDPTHLQVTAALSGSISFNAAMVDAQNSEGIADGYVLSQFSIHITIDEPFTLTLSNVTTTGGSGGSDVDPFSNTVTLTDNNSGQVEEFGRDYNGTYLQNQSSPFVVSGAAGDYTLNAVVQDNFTDTAQGAISTDRSASFQLEVTTVPEPSAWSMLGLGIPALLGFRRFGRRSA